MYRLLLGTAVVADYPSWSLLLQTAHRHIPADAKRISLVTRRTREECVGKPMPVYAFFDKRAALTYLLVQRV